MSYLALSHWSTIDGIYVHVTPEVANGDLTLGHRVLMKFPAAPESISAERVNTVPDQMI